MSDDWVSKDLERQRIEYKWKYIKRTGGPGHYRYWYRDPKTGKLREGRKEEGETPSREIQHDGKTYRVSAATRRGVGKTDAEHNKKYLERMGYTTLTRKIGNDYFVYAHMEKKKEEAFRRAWGADDKKESSEGKKKESSSSSKKETYKGDDIEARQDKDGFFFAYVNGSRITTRADSAKQALKIAKRYIDMPREPPKKKSLEVKSRMPLDLVR